MGDQHRSDETLAAIRDCRERLPSTLHPTKVAFGFDGFIDRIRVPVDERTNTDSYDRLTKLERLGERITQSAMSNSSLSVEWIQTDVRTGGHTAHLGRAYGTLGYDPVLIGTFGQPVEAPFDDEFSDHKVVSLGDPGYTDAIEFNDGKLMLVEMGTTNDLAWDDVQSLISPDKLSRLLDGASLLGIGYVADTPHLPSIITGLRTDVWPRLDEPPENILLDPGDVRKLTTKHLHRSLDMFKEIETLAPLTISANRFETRILADAIDGSADQRTLSEAVATVYDGLNVTRVIGHGIEKSVLVNSNGNFRVAVPTATKPELTTGAGDHFNVGLSLGLINGLTGPSIVALGNAVASWFVRYGDQPTYDEIRSFLDQYERLIQNNDSK